MHAPDGSRGSSEARSDEDTLYQHNAKEFHVTSKDQTPEAAALGYGPMAPLAEIAAEVQRKRQRAEFETGQQLRAAIGVAQTALGIRRRENEALLVPLQREADAAYAAYLEASARLEAQKTKNQGDEMALLIRVHELKKALNEPTVGYGHRILQWQTPDER
jgi:hypothetical protein